MVIGTQFGRTETRECFNCHRRGHIKRDCRMPGGGAHRGAAHANAERRSAYSGQRGMRRSGARNSARNNRINTVEGSFQTTGDLAADLHSLQE